MNRAAMARFAVPAFRDGHAARLRGETLACNPFSEDASEEDVRDAFAQWADGWEAADQVADCAARYSRPAYSVTEAMVRAVRP